MRVMVSRACCFEIRDHQLAAALQFFQLGRLALFPLVRQLFFMRRQFRLHLFQTPLARLGLFHFPVQFAQKP